MSKVLMLRCLVNERLTAAAEEIFALFERTIAEYEEELCRSKEENQRKQHILDSVLSPQVLVEEADETLPTTNKKEAGLSLASQNTNHCQIKQEQFQDFTLTPNLDYAKPELEVSSAPQSYLESEKRQTDHCENNDRVHRNCDSPTDVEIKCEDENYSHNLGSVGTFQPNLDQNTSAESSETKVKKPVGRRSRTCSLCNKKFLSKQDLNRHILIHTGEKPFSCSVCEKSFARKGSLQNHTTTHTGQKPFSCSVCEKTFAQKVHMKSHMLLHTGEKPFSCSECNAKFSWKATLDRHMKSHTGNKPFSCSVCDKRFVRREHLRTHLRTRHTAFTQTEASGASD